MTGGFWAPIVIPIVAALALFSWIAAVYYADAHPGWRNQPRRPVQHITGIRDPIEPVEEREREPAMTTPGAEAPPSTPSPAGQAGATPPRPRTPSESEQLERQARERRLRRDERVGQGIGRGQSLAQFGAEMVPGGHGRRVVVRDPGPAIIAAQIRTLSGRSSAASGRACVARGSVRHQRRVVPDELGCYA